MPGPFFTNVLLIDELNRAAPRAQSALLEAMDESVVTVDGVGRSLPDAFFVVATNQRTDERDSSQLCQAEPSRRGLAAS